MEGLVGLRMQIFDGFGVSINPCLANIRILEDWPFICRDKTELVSDHLLGESLRNNSSFADPLRSFFRAIFTFQVQERIYTAEI